MKNILALMLCLGLSASAATTNVYVSTTGNDSTGNGSLATPWATIQKAVDTLTTKSDLKLVWVRGGNYYNSTVLIDYFTAQNFVISSYSNEVAYIYGGQALTGWVAAGSNGWYAASLGTFPTVDASIGRETAWEPRSLLANGMWVPRAKDPATGAKYAYTSFSGTALVYTNAFLASTNGEIQSDAAWTDTELNITAINTGTKTITTSSAMTRNNMGNEADTITSFSMLNTPAGMTASDSIGQFWWNKTNNTIIYSGSDPSVKTMLIPTVSRIFWLHGIAGAGNQLSNIVVSNINVALTTAPINDGSKDDGATFYFPAIDCVYTTNCSLVNVTNFGCAGKGIGSDNYSPSWGMTVSGCNVHHIGASGIGFEGTTNLYVTNCLVTDCGLNCQVGTGINGYVGALVVNNTCSNITGSAVWIPNPFGSSDHTTYFDNIRVWSNKVLRCNQQLRDMGAIYTIMTTNLSVIQNVVANVYSAQSNFFNLTPLNSSTTNWNGLHGIYLDYGTTKATVISNIAFDCDFPIIHHAGSNNLIANNYFINTRAVPTIVNIHNSTNSPPKWTNNVYYVTIGVPYINTEDSNYVPYNVNTNIAVVSWVGSIIWSASGNNNFNPTNATSSDPQFISLVYPKRLGFSGSTASSLGIQPLTFWDDLVVTPYTTITTLNVGTIIQR